MPKRGRHSAEIIRICFSDPVISLALRTADREDAPFMLQLHHFEYAQIWLPVSGNPLLAQFCREQKNTPSDDHSSSVCLAGCFEAESPGSLQASEVDVVVHPKQVVPPTNEQVLEKLPDAVNPGRQAPSHTVLSNEPSFCGLQSPLAIHRALAGGRGSSLLAQPVAPSSERAMSPVGSAPAGPAGPAGPAPLTCPSEGLGVAAAAGTAVGAGPAEGIGPAGLAPVTCPAEGSGPAEPATCTCAALTAPRGAAAAVGAACIWVWLDAAAGPAGPGPDSAAAVWAAPASACARKAYSSKGVRLQASRGSKRDNCCWIDAGVTWVRKCCWRLLCHSGSSSSWVGGEQAMMRRIP